MKPQSIDVGSIFMEGLWQAFSANMGTFVLVGLMFLAVFLLKAFTPQIKGWIGEKRVRDALDRSGFLHLHDVYLPSRDGVTQIDHVVLAGGAIVVLETKNYSGWIYGGAQQGQWTQTMAGGRVKNKFQNPIRQNYGHVKSVQAALPPGTRVLGLVAFVGDATFKTEIPDGVVSLRQIGKELHRIAKENPPSPTGSSAWKMINGTVAKTDRKQAKRGHRGTLASKRKPARIEPRF